jgi:hypothetical protein
MLATGFTILSTNMYIRLSSIIQSSKRVHFVGHDVYIIMTYDTQR